MDQVQRHDVIIPERIADVVTRPESIPRLALTPLRIAGIYLLFGATLLFISDVVFVAYLSEPLLSQVQALKGGVEIVLTAGLIYLLTRRSYTQLQRANTQVRRKTNLITVLSRVLRHNLRNSMTVVRGQAQALDTRTNDTHETESLDAIIQKTDDILALTEKARILESVVSAEFEYHSVNVTSIIEQAATRVESEHPSATVIIKQSDAIGIQAMPSVNTALRELIENAVTHTGEHPTVTASAERTRLGDTRRLNGVVITVADNGPGLPESEQKVLERGFEDPLVHGSGLGLYTVYWIVTSHGGSITVTTDENGTTVEMTLPAGLTPTVTDEETLQPRLERVQDRFEAVFEESFDAMLIADDDGRYTEANEAAADLLGLPAEEILGQTIADFTPDSFDTETAWQGFQDSRRDRGTVPLVRADGERRIVEYAATRDIVPGQHLAVLRDVTERRERERELELYESIFSAVGDGVYVLDESFEFVRVNDAYCEMTGYSREELLGAHCSLVVADATAAESEQRFQEILDGDEDSATIEADIYRADGSRLRAESNFTSVEAPEGDQHWKLGVVRDVSERVAREQELKRTHDMLAQTERIADVGGWEIDAETRSLFWTDNLYDLLGVDDGEEPSLRAALDSYHDDDRPVVEDAIETAFERGEAFDIEARVELPDGEHRCLRVQGTPVTDGGEVAALRGVAQDITERRERDRALRDLYEIIADRRRSFDEQVQALLELGRDYLGTEYGTLSEIQGDDYIFRAVNTDDGSVEAGDVVPVSATNCEIVASTEQTVVLGDIERDAPEETDRAGFTDWGISCYIGSPVFSADDVYGTFCFYDTEARSGQFSEWEVTLVNLMSRWVSYGLQRVKNGS